MGKRNFELEVTVRFFFLGVFRKFGESIWFVIVCRIRSFIELVMF